ncbi:hypothetical protein [Paenibacillus pini]|uniref:Lipoprotein n=1 Tax=Paenibacillus pini JCM 16418 TaxID=1236976 RepID=W7Y8C4_9BACL|nr:hypothetical protein [Paenibacillus pini]GAF07165.1 hypothetical protein JCM16418_1156 [Paenibacillus pini JCM 16418]
MMKNNLKFTILCTVCLSFCLGLGGCGLFESGKTPEEWFKQTLAGLAGKDEFTFRGEEGLRRNEQDRFVQNMIYEGKLTQHDKLTMTNVVPKIAAHHGKDVLEMEGKEVNEVHLLRQKGDWMHINEDGKARTQASLSRFNPLEQLEAIHELPKEITEETAAARGTKVLKIELTPAAAHTWLSKQLKQEMAVLREEQVMAKGGTPKNKEKLEKVWKQGNDQLEQMLKQANVKTTYHLTINRKSGFPKRLSSKTYTRYTNAKGQQEQETLINDVLFSP